MKRTSLLRTLPLVLLLAALTGCSKDDDPVSPGNNNNNNNNNNSGTVTVKITAPATSAFVGDTLLMAATVTGSTNTGVTWSVDPAVGAIDAQGRYIAPATITGDSVVVTVKAASAADTKATATSTITVKGPGFTTTMPGLGSTFVEHIYATDSLGNKIDGTDNDNITSVAFINSTYGGVSGVTALRRSPGGDTVFLRYDHTGDIFYASSNILGIDGMPVWLRIPAGTRISRSGTLISSTDYTYTYTATYEGRESFMVGTSTLDGVKIKVKTIGARTGANMRTVTTEIDYLYIPSIGWFGKESDLITRVDQDGTSVIGTVSALTSYVLR